MVGPHHLQQVSSKAIQSHLYSSKPESEKEMEQHMEDFNRPGLKETHITQHSFYLTPSHVVLDCKGDLEIQSYKTCKNETRRWI